MFEKSDNYQRYEGLKEKKSQVFSCDILIIAPALGKQPNYSPDSTINIESKYQ